MAPADALSHRDYVDTSLDNADTSIVPSPTIINALDLSLVRYIQSSSVSDPLVLRAIQNLSEETPLFPHSALADWTFEMVTYTINTVCMFLLRHAPPYSIRYTRPPLTGHLVLQTHINFPRFLPIFPDFLE
jgi:hypothetical protein